MATLVLSAAGAALGAGFGGTVLGLSGAVIGRAIGATIGRAIDQRILGAGSEPVEVGRVDRLRLTGAGEGAAIGRLWGRMRVGGQVIWATEFKQTVRRRKTGKGAPQPKIKEFSYSVSLAVALCEGEILRVGRIWADGNEISPNDLNLRVHTGSEDQLPDALIESVQGSGLAPAYRGVAYVVIEDLELAPFGNRVPQFTFEVFRPAQGALVQDATTLDRAIRGVALIPGCGEYALATTPVHYAEGPGRNRTANVHSPSGQTDFATSLVQLEGELPRANAASLVVSWFGGDLRCAQCALRPKVEQTDQDGVGMPWTAGGISRSAAELVPTVDGASIYGGTPADASVIEAIQALRDGGKDVTFYPFILMDQVADNLLSDPWTGAPSQPALPWRGRITLSVAPGRDGTPDGTVEATTEVAAFFGTASAADFTLDGTTVTYTGPEEWSYRRFILHYAALCAAAGGIEAFCIGSEMRSLTQIRGPANSFPAVTELRALASEVRILLGPDTKIGYAADWSEYFGYHVDGDVFFHLDPLWADPEIDFVGIDNYMPLSDWRDGENHADAAWGAIYDLGYLKSNIAGGEGFDWYYDSPEGALAQRRLPIRDAAFGEDWIYRYKDIRSWWSNLHHDRVGGLREANPSVWIPQSKPVRFTEYGCPAVDKGTNQPNRFIDDKSSESGLPVWSNGRRDDLVQMQYLLAMASFWTDDTNNPISSAYGGPMVDFDHSLVWAWDTRPFPEFPGQAEVWSDAGNYVRGHWLNGRASNQPLSAVVTEICGLAGSTEPDCSRLFGLVRGFQQPDLTTGRAALQPLMLAFGFDAMERDGKLVFRNRDGRVTAEIGAADLCLVDDLESGLERVRSADVETSGQVRVGHVDAEASYEIRYAEARFPDERAQAVSQTDLPLALTSREGRETAERWLTEARIARDAIRFALPKSKLHLGVGDVVRYDAERYRIDRVEQSDAQLIEAVRIEAGPYAAAADDGDPIMLRRFIPPLPVQAVFLDLPLLTGAEVPHAPHLAVASEPWPGSVAIWSSVEDAGYELNRLIAVPSVIGTTETPLMRAPVGLWDMGAPLRVRLSGGELSSSSRDAVLNGANVLAIGDGSAARWEILQFAEGVLVAPDTYDLSVRLRGQLGTDGIMPATWPVGSAVVLIDLSLSQIDLPPSSRGLSRHYRIGPSARGYDDPVATHLVQAFDGIGLRPYPVAHLRAETTSSGDVTVRWVRRTRVDGDTWQSVDVPLGEETEAYQIRILQGAAIRAEYGVASPTFVYTATMRASDGVTGDYLIAVAQLSMQFGPGPFRSVDPSG